MHFVIESSFGQESVSGAFRRWMYDMNAMCLSGVYILTPDCYCMLLCYGHIGVTFCNCVCKEGSKVLPRTILTKWSGFTGWYGGKSAAYNNIDLMEMVSFQRLRLSWAKYAHQSHTLRGDSRFYSFCTYSFIQNNFMPRSRIYTQNTLWQLFDYYTLEVHTLL